ncbi:MAG: hypothetical protein P8K80_06520 [Phycisphaerales bacterium]|nr:hypothetical protein [Phycisphaerales bacterium]
MLTTLHATATLLLALSASASAQDAEPSVTIGHRGLHGYIGSHAGSTPREFRYGAGFYASVWSLIERPIRGFQIGLPSTWLTPDNSDNTTEPLCPVGTIARDNWPERGPTYGSVFQTVEGGLGYWAGNRFHYGPPKFSMNATPNCYSTEVASPGWPFFHSSEPLPDDMLGIAQLSNRLLIPPDGLTFQGTPKGELLGYAYMALPLTDARDDPQPTGTHSWTLFLDAANFKGPLAYYLPECWSRISRDYPFDHGRCLDSRPASGPVAGSMEINTVPEFLAKDADGTLYTRIPQLQFPVDDTGRTVLVRDVVMYSKDALWNDVLAWRRGGDAPTGAFKVDGMARPEIRTGSVTYRQNKKKITGINELATPTVFDGNVFGLTWGDDVVVEDGMAKFPTFFRDAGETRESITAADVPAKTTLRDRAFPGPRTSPPPYTAEPLSGSWATPGPAAGPFETMLLDGSTVRYCWYRFIDQPVFQQFQWSQKTREDLQALIVKMHAAWSIDGTYLPGSEGELASFDPALFVTPPKGMEHGYVPIVTWQGITPQ